MISMVYPGERCLSNSRLIKAVNDDEAPNEYLEISPLSRRFDIFKVRETY